MAKKKDNTVEIGFEEQIWSAADKLRGNIDASEYKNVVLGLIFLKYISDKFDQKYQELVEEGEGFEEDRDEYASENIFFVPESARWKTIAAAAHTPEIGKAIDEAMRQIEAENNKLKGILPKNFARQELDKRRLGEVVDLFANVKMAEKGDSRDILGRTYEYCLAKFAEAEGKNAGEFYTPREIVKMMVSLLEPKPGETVYDPACGTGGMLIEAVRQMDNSKLAYGKLYGQEKNLSTSAIARMNLYLHGAKDFRIAQGDTLREPAFRDGNILKTFDCVLANPPFSLKSWGSDEFSSDPWGRNIWGAPTDKSADFAWVQHMICSMDKKSGRCAVVLPQGALFHGGKEGAIRKELIKSDRVEAVIALASGVFYSTGVSACVLFLRNDKPAEHQGRVCIIDGSKIFTAQRAQNVISEENAQEMLSLYRSYEPVVEKCAIATLADIEREGYVLSANNYVERKRERVELPAETRKRFYDLLQQTKESEEKFLDLLARGGYVDGE